MAIQQPWDGAAPGHVQSQVMGWPSGATPEERLQCEQHPGKEGVGPPQGWPTRVQVSWGSNPCLTDPARPPSYYTKASC